MIRKIILSDRGRLTYFLYGYVIPYLLFYFYELFDKPRLMFMLLIFYFPWFTWVYIQRCYDIGIRGWKTFYYALIPIFNLYIATLLLCRKNSKEKNKKIELILFSCLFI